VFPWLVGELVHAKMDTRTAATSRTSVMELKLTLRGSPPGVPAGFWGPELPGLPEESLMNRTFRWPEIVVGILVEVIRKRMLSQISCGFNTVSGRLRIPGRNGNGSEQFRKIGGNCTGVRGVSISCSGSASERGEAGRWYE